MLYMKIILVVTLLASVSNESLKAQVLENVIKRFASTHFVPNLNYENYY